MKRLLFSAAVLAVTALQAQDCTDLFFSEYVEGSSKNKALEIYNPTENSIDLSAYLVKRYKNGQTSPDTELQLSGILTSKDVVVISNGEITDTGFGTVDSVLFAYADINGSGIYATSPMFFNGNDALTIEKADGTIVDLFGKVGEDPDNGWNNIESMDYVAGEDFWTAWTKDHTMIRKASVKKGVSVNPDFFNTGLEYDTLPQNTFSDLGRHICDCGSTPVENWEPLAIEENRGFDFIAFSNNGMVTVGAASEIKTMELINFVGQVVATYSPNSKSFNVSTDLLSGNYIIRLTSTSNKVSVSKLNVQ